MLHLSTLKQNVFLRDTWPLKNGTCKPDNMILDIAIYSQVTAIKQYRIIK